MSNVSDKARREVEHVVQMAVRGALENANISSEQITSALNEIQSKIQLRQAVQRELASVFKDFFETLAKVA